jgi:phosphoribosylformimino-5-aminoimidazole carboxamide ribotide isomerase
MRIIAAIDIIGGKCVRLSRGDFSTQKIYNEDPVEVAREMEDNGIRYIHVVDLDGARNKMITNYRVLDKIASQTNLAIDFGGGIRKDHDIDIVFASGVRQVTAGSIAVSNSGLVLRWLSKYGNQRIILGADSKDRKISVNGWQQETEEDVVQFIQRYTSVGMKYAICTDVNRDGMLQGPATELCKEILSSVKVNLIASGGISSMKDIKEIKEAGCEGVIIGKALYEGKIKLSELKDLC